MDQKNHMVSKNNLPTSINLKGWKINPGLIFYLVFSMFLLLAIFDFFQGFILLGNRPSLESRRVVVFLIVFFLPAVLWAYGLLIAFQGKFTTHIVPFINRLLNRIPKVVRLAAAIFCLFFPTILFLFSSFGNFSFIYWLRFFILFSCGFIAASLLVFPQNKFFWLLYPAGMILLASVIFVLGDWMTSVSDYPFALTWSEGNRFWDYSIMFGMGRYLNPSGNPIVPFLDAGRQFLWSLPFLIPSIGIRGMRLWNVILWVFPPMFLGWSAVFSPRTFKREWIWQTGFGLWSFLFLSQGPIYPPLVICAILIVIAVRLRNIVFPIIIIAIASYYARITRWTWMYAPGLWAGLLALLEINAPSFKLARWKDFVRPIVLGISGLLGAELLPVIVGWLMQGTIVKEGSMVSALAESVDFVQPMLWDRLLPNLTYPPGLLLGFLWMGGPLMFFLVWMALKKLWNPNWLQRYVIIIFVGVFTILGLVISVKIGGGSNLHNLDILWVTLTLVAAWVYKNWLKNHLAGLTTVKSVTAVFILALLFPATMLIQNGEPFSIPNEYFVTSSMQKLNAEIKSARENGEILFLDQRQLLTFGYVKDVPLVAEYEKKLVMDQAMSGNKEYFDGFYKDLKNHRFSLIITEPLQKAIVSGSERNFAEENNVWVYWVSKPLLKYYEPKVTYDEVGVQLLVPREN